MDYADFEKEDELKCPVISQNKYLLSVLLRRASYSRRLYLTTSYSTTPMLANLFTPRESRVDGSYHFDGVRMESEYMSARARLDGFWLRAPSKSSANTSQIAARTSGTCRLISGTGSILGATARGATTANRY